MVSICQTIQFIMKSITRFNLTLPTNNLMEEEMKILNLYAGIGGNRKLWGDEHEITAVELNPEIAAIYQDFFPDDTVIVADAHQYLLDHYKEFDFIWSSPPCPSHSRARFGFGVCGHGYDYVYPDMSLYQEVILLKHVFKGLWIIENVIPYYEYLIQPRVLGRHAYWSNFDIPNKIFSVNGGIAGNTKREERHIYFDLSNYKTESIKKDMLLRNCVEPEAGEYILNCATNTFPEYQEGLFTKDLT